MLEFFVYVFLLCLPLLFLALLYLPVFSTLHTSFKRSVITSALVFYSDWAFALLVLFLTFEVEDTFVVCLLVPLRCLNFLHQDSCMQRPALLLKLSSHPLHL